MVHVSDGLKQDVNSDAGTSAEKKKLSLRVHEVAQDCQNQNGLRHGDYQQYRRYCTRRLKRVRSSEDVRFMFGKGKGFTRKVLQISSSALMGAWYRPRGVKHRSVLCVHNESLERLSTRLQGHTGTRVLLAL